METYMTQLLLVWVILVELVIYWSLPKTKVVLKYKKQKRQYRHTEAYFAKKFK